MLLATCRSFVVSPRKRASGCDLVICPGNLDQSVLEFSRRFNRRTEMKNSRFSEKQIIEIVKRQEAG